MTGLYYIMAPCPATAALSFFVNSKILRETKSRRRRLMAIYNRLLVNKNPFFDGQPLLRYPLILPSVEIKRLMLRNLKTKGFYLDDNWYDDCVYPARFSGLSSYEIGSCTTKEEITKRIVNLPLHRGMTITRAQTLAEEVNLYRTLHFKQKFDSQTWQKACQEFDSLECNLLTSWEEGEAYKSLGQKIWRIVVEHDGRVVALAMAVLISARRGRFLKVAGGPLFKTKDVHLQRLLVGKLKTIALKEKCVFIRLQAYLPDRVENYRFMRNLGVRVSPSNLNAPNTLKIDLMQPLSKILSSKYYKNTRNYINQAKRNKLRITEDANPKALRRFLDLLQQTQQAQNFIANSSALIEAQFKAYRKSNKLHLYQVFDAADSQSPDKILASAFVIYNGSEAVYLYGASSENGQRLKAPYFLQWRIIADAHARGLKTYNLWGVAPAKAGSQHRFAGVTRFKKNFASDRYDYLPAHDLILNSLRYWPVYLLEMYERKKRRI